MNEHNAREYVSKLRRFYTDALIYAVVNLGLILIWAISGGGIFLANLGDHWMGDWSWCSCLFLRTHAPGKCDGALFDT